MALFTPLTLGSITLPNRIGMSALTRNRADVSTVPNPLMKEYYLQRAAGGAGLIVTEGTLVTRQGTEWPQAPGIWNEEQTAAWKSIVDAIHTTETKVYCQLWHLGRANHPDAPEQIKAGEASPTREYSGPVYAPSALSARGGKFRFLPGAPGYVTPTEIEDPATLIPLFKNAAINAKEAGFDGVELHGANGYLIHQFLDSTSNARTDKWGGSVENRARFGLEILKVLVEVFGADVGVKLSPSGGYNDMGMPLPETIATYNYFISEADKLGLSYILLARYVPALDMEIDGKLRATQHDVVATFRPAITHARVFSNGGFTPAEAEALVAAGTLDGVLFGVLWIAHPDLARRVRHGKPLDNTPDPKTYYGHLDRPAQLGFTDYPAFAGYD
ncbi:flavoprotein NADH-dependent oxidoreductase [Mycena maculata]|uniref:Flavoprotein NADH-dependent oxidoreductase n=1 Tax=Mycena maculata TaxID=230809 RepID=A0AAD7JW80_9AGAR|nr:flavoprotein NADH-dependent oxidoreductase [Mycena maculata]